MLNSPVGGANPDAVEVAARLGGRVVWMPTVPALALTSRRPPTRSCRCTRGLAFRQVDVLDDACALLPAWQDVLDVVAAHDLVLASGHLTCAQSLLLFRAAKAAGVTRMLLNHPRMPFLQWDDAAAPEFAQLGVVLELGILPDILTTDGPPSTTLGDVYPHDMLGLRRRSRARPLPDDGTGPPRLAGRPRTVCGGVRHRVDHDHRRPAAGAAVIRIALLPGDGVGEEVLEGPVPAPPRAGRPGGLVEVTGPLAGGCASCRRDRRGPSGGDARRLRRRGRDPARRGGRGPSRCRRRSAHAPRWRCTGSGRATTCASRCGTSRLTSTATSPWSAT